jgi:2,5-dichloro-2,5-cyclohexadiene-1,4-diol dehydrogenase 1
MYDFKGKSVIVTGAGSGMGRSTALLLGQSGAKVTAADVDGESAARTVSAIEKSGAEAQAVTCDVSQEEHVKRMVNRAVASYGRLDAAANCAGRSSHSLLLHELTLDKWQRMIDINLTGAFLCLKYQILAMLETGGGSIVVVSSTSAVKAYPLVAEYSASKAGILGLVRSAAIEYGKRGIRVNTVLPGTTDTPMYRGFMDQHPELYDLVDAQQFLGRVGKPEELAAAICWLLSSQASYITGMSYAVDGGQTAG